MTTKSAIEIAREALESAQSELRDNHYDHPVHKQIRAALAALPAQTVEPVIDLNELSINQLVNTYVDVFGPLPEAMIRNDILWEINELIKAAPVAQAQSNDAATLQAEAIQKC